VTTYGAETYGNATFGLGSVTELTIPFVVASAKIVGQGNQPELWVLYTTDDVSDSVPTWADATQKVRAFSTSRGRESELSEVDAGTATLTLDNRTRTFDPIISGGIRPMNQWWLREQFSGETQDIFKGYADSYDQQWEGMDAVAVVSCTDEFKVLARDELPATNPPGDSYEDLIIFDRPMAYWRMDDHNTQLVLTAAGMKKRRTTSQTIQIVKEATAKIGRSLHTSGMATSSTSTAIVGDRGGSISLPAVTDLHMEGMERGEGGDCYGATEMTVEGWVRLTGSLPAAGEYLVRGPATAASTYQYSILLNPAGTLRFTVIGVPGGTVTATGGTIAADSSRWYYVVGTITGGNIRLYVDAVQVASSAWSSVVQDALTAGFFIGDEANLQTYGFDEVAIYRAGLTVDRITAHYQAGTERGFAEQRSDLRITAALDEAGSQAPRSVGTGTRNVLPEYMHAQSLLEEIRTAVKGEAVDAALFITKDGSVKFLPDGHRSSSPYNTVQATFDDDGTDLPYLNVDLDYSDAFIRNEVHGTRDGGTTQTVSDQASIDEFFRIPLSLTGLPNISDANVLTIVTALLAKYKDPFQRILNLDIDTSDPAVAEAAFRLDIGDRIRVFRTPPGGGARIDQTLFVQKIAVSGANDGKPWSIKLGVSSL
jgi:hypothetical protein